MPLSWIISAKYSLICESNSLLGFKYLFFLALLKEALNSLITLEFSFPLNTSAQVGDIAYYCDTEYLGAYHSTAAQSDIIRIGEIKSILPWNGVKSVMECETFLAYLNLPEEDDFIMFSKDNKVNLSSITGYYAEVKLVNNSLDESELFSVGCGFSESSK